MAWLNRLSNLIRRRDLNPEIDEELQFHIDARIRDNVAAGMSEDDARRDALLRFGSRAGIRERTRDANVAAAIETLTQDLTFAARSLRKRPGFTAVAVLTLALGIGANIAIFTIVQGVLIRPLAFAESDRVHVVTYAPISIRYWLYPGLSDSHYLDFRRSATLFESLATFGYSPVALTGAGEAAQVSGAQVTTDFFRVLRVNPILGRSFATDDDQPDRGRVVLVGHDLWTAKFGANVDLVNQSIVLDGVPHTVIGILPAGFDYPQDAQLWTPLAVRLSPSTTFTRPVIGRLRPGVTRAEAKAGLDAFVTGLPGDAQRGNWSADVIPLKRAVAGETRESLIIFTGAVALVLLIACANVSNLVLMRALSRQPEITTRLALGASRGRIVRQLLTESTLLAVAGGLAGALIAVGGLPALLALVPAGRLPRLAEIHMDAWTVAFTVGLSVAIGLVVGLVPALQSTRGGVVDALRHRLETAGPRTSRIRHALVVAEVALAVVLVIGAGLLIKSLTRLQSVPLGFQPEQVLTMTVNLPPARYADAPGMHEFYRHMLASLETLPDVTSAAAVNWRPFGTMALRGDIAVEGLRRVSETYNPMKVSVSPGYFRTLGIRLATGRDFTAQDDEHAPGVAMVSASVARSLWLDDDPLGKRLAFEDNPRPQDWVTVIGVVDDIRQSSVKQDVMPAIYRPYRQTSQPNFLRHVSFLVRVTGDPQALAPALRGVLQSVDRDQTALSIVPLEDTVAVTIAEPRFYARLLSILSTLALFLAAIGIYAVLGAAVAERRREIGIRVALGADKSTVVRMVLLHTIRLAAVGLTLGLAGALALTGLLTALLFQVTPTDAGTFIIAAAVLLGVALLAGLLPARRATTVDPLVVLKSL